MFKRFLRGTAGALIAASMASGVAGAPLIMDDFTDMLEDTSSDGGETRNNSNGFNLNGGSGGGGSGGGADGGATNALMDLSGGPSEEDVPPTDENLIDEDLSAEDLADENLTGENLTDEGTEPSLLVATDESALLRIEIVEIVPEPASLSLLGAGIMGLGYFGKRRRV